MDVSNYTIKEIIVAKIKEIIDLEDDK